MPKAPKHPSTRKPPEPSDSHADIAEWLQNGVMPGIQSIASHLDGVIRETLPGAQYAVKWQKAYYGLPGRGWVIEMAAYHVSVNLVFFAGAKFNPEPPQGEGSRYIKIRSLDDAKAPEIGKWIKQAAEHPGWT